MAKKKQTKKKKAVRKKVAKKTVSKKKVAKKKAKKLAPCGTLQRYKTCNCAKCRAAHAAYQRSYEARRRAEGAGPRKMVVVDENTHTKVLRRCEKDGVSMRQWVNDALVAALKRK